MFAGDFEQVHAALKAQVQRSRVALAVTAVAGIAVLAVVVILALNGIFFLAISVPLPIVILGGIGHAAHKASGLRGHLQSFERRLPKATAKSP